MSKFLMLTKRNIKLFFKDKGLFFSSMISPIILLVLYATFLSNVFKDSFYESINKMGVNISTELINGLVGGQLVASLLAVSCITVSFCSNIIMIQDKYTGVRADLLVSPVRKSTLSLSYYFATLFNTLIICFVTYGAALIYLSFVGWYLTIIDVVLIGLDIIILSMFGTALSSIICFFLSSQGQASAVGTIISAGYGFICGAYMPIYSFGETLRNVLGFLPGTYGTSLIKNHSLSSVLSEIGSIEGFPSEGLNKIKETLDCKINFFNTEITQSTMYLIMFTTVILLMGIYVIINILDNKKKKNKN